MAVSPPAGPVADRAHVMSQAAVQRLEGRLRAHEADTGAQFVVLTLASLEGEPLEAAAVRIFEDWKIGQRGHDNGLLLLLVIDRRQIRIEVGYGLEGALTDVFTRHLIEEILAPRLRRGDVDGAIEEAMEAMIARAGREAAGQRQLRRPHDAGPAALIGLVVLVVLMMSFLSVVRRQQRLASEAGGGASSRRGGATRGILDAVIDALTRGGGGGFGGGSSWGGGGWRGGGGSSGGGGASGGW